MVLIDKRNPILILKPELRQLILLRRMVHKLFDMIKCDEWEKIINNEDHKFLVLRDSYLTFNLICEPNSLKEHLNKLLFTLKGHISKCKVSLHSFKRSYCLCVYILNRNATIKGKCARFAWTSKT